MSEKKFEDSMDRLNQIVELLEKNDVEIEKAISLFEEGLKEAQYCDSQLKAFEEKVAALVSDHQEDGLVK